MDIDIEPRLQTMERHLRNMRMAIIVVVAFFLYESLMPAELRPGNRDIEDIVKTRELVLIDSRGEMIARLSVPRDEQLQKERAQLVLSDSLGNQITLDSDAIKLFVREDVDTIEQLSITPREVVIYNKDGTRANSLN